MLEIIAMQMAMFRYFMSLTIHMRMTRVGSFSWIITGDIDTTD